MTLDLITMVGSAVAAKTSNWPIYGDDNSVLDRNSVLTASENLRCLRELKFSKTTPAKAFENWGMAERGHAVEAWVVDRLRESLGEGAYLSLAGDLQRSFLDSDTGLSGTPDGVWSAEDGTHTLLEFKSVDPRTNMESMSAPKPQHYAQVQQNMWLLRDHGIAVSSAVVLYIDASDFRRMKQFDVAYDNGEVAKRAEIRAGLLFDSTDPAALPAEGLTNNGCTYCTFKEECSAIQVANGERRKSEKPVMPAFAPRGITESVREFGSIKDQIKALEARADTLAATIKEYAVGENQMAFDTSAYSVKVSEVAGRRSFDTKAFEKVHGAILDDFYKVGKPSLRLEVSAKSDT